MLTDEEKTAMLREAMAKAEGVQSIIELNAAGQALLPPPGPADLAFTVGALSDMDPLSLRRAYEALFFSSNRYILLAEKRIEDDPFKRDFAGDMMDRLPNSMRVVDRRDAWVLLEKLHNEDPRSFSPAF